MSSQREYRHLLLKLGASSLAREERKPSLVVRETRDTLILGALSASLGMVVLIGVLMGLGGFLPLPALGIEPAMAARGGNVITREVRGIAALIGEFLGLAGIMLARYRHGGISPLSMLGTVICVTDFILFFCGWR